MDQKEPLDGSCRIWASQRCAVTAEASKQTFPVNSNDKPGWLVGLISVCYSYRGCLNCKQVMKTFEIHAWVHVTNGPAEGVEHVKSVAFNICDSCSSSPFKSKRETLSNLLLPCLVSFKVANEVWWANKISSYTVKYFFHLFFYHMCNIFVMILYIKNKASLQFVRFFFFSFFPCCVIIYLFLFWTPVRVFLGKLMCGCPRGLRRGTDLEFSGMSSKWFLHVMLLMWGYPLHIV